MTHLRRLIVIAVATAALSLAGHAQAQVATGAVTAVETFADWSLYADGKTPHQFCFVTSVPKSSEPAETAREAPHLYISAWPKDGVKAEFSVILGFPTKKGSDVTASVASADFRLFANDDRAYVQDPTLELKLLDAMKKGAKVSVAATTQTGTAVTDSYSLSGLGQALQKLQGTCF
jgi:invasion protein IalB